MRAHVVHSFSAMAFESGRAYPVSLADFVPKRDVGRTFPGNREIQGKAGEDRAKEGDVGAKAGED